MLRIVIAPLIEGHLYNISGFDLAASMKLNGVMPGIEENY
jgi:hypothetical protein